MYNFVFWSPYFLFCTRLFFVNSYCFNYTALWKGESVSYFCIESFMVYMYYMKLSVYVLAVLSFHVYTRQQTGVVKNISKTIRQDKCWKFYKKNFTCVFSFHFHTSITQLVILGKIITKITKFGSKKAGVSSIRLLHDFKENFS